jgi:hypothetical protein
VQAGLSPTGRALRALELLQARPGITAAQLAAQLGVTERAARRAPCDEVARYVRPPMGRLQRTDDGERCVLTGTASNPAMYAGEWLAAIPIRFHVAGGPELRAAVAAVTERLTAALGTAVSLGDFAESPRTGDSALGTSGQRGVPCLNSGR